MKWARFSRPLLLLGIGIALSHSGSAIAQNSTFERNIDRPGSDQYSFNLTRPNARDCRNVCLIDFNCRAWTYVEPGIQGPQARCWIKYTVPAPQPNTCCVSGVKF